MPLCLTIVRQSGIVLGVTTTRWIRAELLAPYLEHDGTINGDDYLEQMADSGVEATEDDPIELLVWDEDGRTVATIFNGNHRTLIAIARQDTIPFIVLTDEFSQMPGTPVEPALVKALACHGDS